MFFPKGCRVRFHAVTFSLFLLFCNVFSYAQAPLNSYRIEAVKANSLIKVDGILDESIWENTRAVSNFIENEPRPNTPSSQGTEGRIIYDNDAIYVGARMFDSAPDSILKQLTNRDEIGNTDYIGIWLSCFQDGINAFQFIVTPSGIQNDTQISAIGEDKTWNAVWQCNTKIDALGWTAEFKIPYSALRFPEALEQVWDLNFIRYIRREREISYWRPVDPKVEGLINQSGKLVGISNIEPPVRLFLYPYASAYYEVQSQVGSSPISGTSYNGGLDLKYGINDAFTLDMTLVPDFGQVQFDNLILNLSPFEIQFVENRPFFMEGTELFNKGGFFYSRRVGSNQLDFSHISEYTDQGYELNNFDAETQLINATKLSGRNKNGLGLGLFNAISNPAFAELSNGHDNVEVEISPLTNYNIIVADQNLKNNSYITFINTNVTRAGSYYDANLTGTEFRIRNKSNVFQVSGIGGYNFKSNYFEADKDGYTSSLNIEKLGGKFTYGIGTLIMNDTYDPNDLGFLSNNNAVTTTLKTAFRQFQPFGRFNRFTSNLNLYVNRLYNPSVNTGYKIENKNNLFSRTFQFYQFGFDYSPEANRDYFEPRTSGRFYLQPASWNVNAYFSSDYRKRAAIDFNLWGGQTTESGRDNFNWRLAPRFRVNDRLMLTYVWSRQNSYNEVGWVNFENDEIILGRRNRYTHTHVLTTNYIFTNRMGLSFRLRHYWSKVNYNNFSFLQQDGTLQEAFYNNINENGSSVHNSSYNAFTIDMVYRWVFSPGSELSLVWKQSIIDFGQALPESYVANVEDLFSLPQNNSFSVKVLYFIDYLNFKRKGKFIEN